MSRKLPLLLAAALALLVASDAAALSVTVGLDGGMTQTLTDQSSGNPLGCSTAGSTTTCGGSGWVGGSAWTVDDWAITADADPFVIFDFSLTNTTAATQDFTILVSLATSIAGPTATGGSVQGGLTADATAGTLGHNASSDPMYQALIDAGLHQSMLAFDSSISAFAFGSASLGVEDFGLPGLTVPGPGVASSIAVELSFSLTPGDRATFSGSFVVEPVPEPGTAMLLGLGLALALRAGARRS